MIRFLVVSAIFSPVRATARHSGVLRLASSLFFFFLHRLECVRLPRPIPKVCPIRVLVLLGSVRPCSLLPVRTLPFKINKRNSGSPLPAVREHSMPRWHQRSRKASRASRGSRPLYHAKCVPPALRKSPPPGSSRAAWRPAAAPALWPQVPWLSFFFFLCC
jgi:hypothetical protein